MSQFTLTAVDPEPRVWEGDHGAFHIWTIAFEGLQGRVDEGELKQKATTPAPTVGQTVDGEIVSKPGRKPELKKIFSPNGGGGGFKGGGGKSPVERAEIRRMSSQRAAIELLAVEVAAGLRFDEKQKASDLLLPRIDWMEQDAKKAGEQS